MAALALASVTGVLAFAQPAQAAITAGGMRNAVTGRCIDDSVAYGLRAFPCNGMNYQTWYFDWGNTNTIRNANTNLCIDDSLAFGLRAIPCNGTDFQRWTGYYDAYDYTGFTFDNIQTGRCIDDSFEFGLRAYDCNWGPYQRFV